MASSLIFNATWTRRWTLPAIWLPVSLTLILWIPLPLRASDDPIIPISDQVTEDTSQGTVPGGPVCQVRIGDVTGSLSLSGPLCGPAHGTGNGGSGSGNRPAYLPAYWYYQGVS